jgi:hypothetical protein
MPGTAPADESSFLQFYRPEAKGAAGDADLPGGAAALAPRDRSFLLNLQRRALQYFLDNQMPGGLVLDRQRNHGPRRADGLCSTAATGMGFIALALASAPPYRLITPSSAAARIRTGLLAVLERLPHDHGAVPHFTDSVSEAIHGVDHCSTVETSWLAAGSLWAGAFLQDATLGKLATHFYERIDWRYWTAPDHADARGLLRHGKDRDGRFLACSWDRCNGETAFMYVLAAGAAEDRAVGRSAWVDLQPFYGTVADLRFNNADLGLFVFQYGLDLLDLYRWQPPGDVDLLKEARIATLANRLACAEVSRSFLTYRRHWGLSSGDGPGDSPGDDVYRCYAPSGPVDGTAHLTATLASLAHSPGAVLENLYQAQHDRDRLPLGRYGFSNINHDRSWISRDVVGIDLGAVVLALDNYLMDNRVRNLFARLACVRRGMERLGFTRATPPSAAPSAPGLRQAG